MRQIRLIREVALLKRSPREEEKGTRTEQMTPKLFQAESFAMRVREMVDELFKDKHSKDMYSDIGKPAAVSRS